MLRITKYQSQKKYNDGVIPLVVVLVLAITSAVAVGGGYFLNLAGQKGFLTSNISQMVKDVETRSGYLDEERVENSFFDDKVVGTALLSNGSFSVYKVISGEVKGDGNQFVNRARILFLSGDQALDSFSDGIINTFYLKDGTRAVGQIMDRMIANLVLDSSTSYAIKILQGKVEEGRLIGDFVGQTYDTGFVVAGTVDKNGKISNVVIKTGAQKTTEVESTVAKNAISLFNSIYELSANIDVLGISDYQPTGFNKPIFDESTGTWAFAGGMSGGAILTSPIQGVVNYIQSVAQSISSGNSVYQQTVGEIIQGITDIKSDSSKLTITTLDNIATLSVDLSGITAVGVSDSSINESDLASSNDPTGGQCLTYNNSTGGFTWGSCGTSGGSGTITGVTAGNGLTGGGTSGATSLALNIQSGGGLVATSSGLSLIRTCGDGELLKWTDSTSSWDCAVDAGGAGGGISTLQADDITVVSSATTIDFLGADFDLTNSPAGEGNLSIDYTTSKIIRSDQTQSIAGAWTFVTAPVISTISNTGTLTLPTSTDTIVGRNTSDTLTNKTISGASNTISGLSVANFTSGNISQWTNNSNYLTGNQTITLSGDVSGSGATTISTTIGNGAISFSKMANLVANSIIGNNTGSAATPIALTGAQVKTLLGISTSDISGLGTIATQSASNVYVTGGQISGVTIGGTASGLSISGSSNTLSNIGNSSLSNSSVTINSSGILSGGGSLSLGGTLNLSATEADTFSSVTGRGDSTATALTLSSATPITFSGTTPTITFSGGNTIFDLTGATTRTLNILNSTTSQVANVIVDGAISASNFSGTSSGTNTGDQTITLTSDVTGSGTGSFATTIAGGAVTLGKMANLAANSIIGNNTGSSATPIALTGSQVKTLLGISTSDVSGLGTIATQSASNVFITGGQLSGLVSINGATISGGSISGGSLSTTAVNGVTTGNIVLSTGSYADPGWITSLSPTKVLPDQTGNSGKVLGTNGSALSWITNSSGVAWGAITGLLDDQTDLTASLSGKLSKTLTSANIFVGNGSNIATGVAVTGDISINNTGLTAIGSGAVSLTKMANLAANSIIGNNTGAPATPLALSASQVKTLLGISTSDISGLGTIATQSASNVYITGGQLVGGTINNITIGGTTRAGGNFTILDSNGNTTLGDTNTDTLTIKAGSSGTGITLYDSSFANCSALETVAGVLTCGTDDTGAGGGISTIQIGDADVVTSATTVDFLAADFDVTNSPAGEGNISIDYTNSKITRTDQVQSISGGWTFSDLTISDINIPLTGSSLALDFNNALDRTLTITNSSTGLASLSVEGTIGASNFSGSSSGTNTGDQTITLTSDVTGSGTGSFATTIASGAVTLGKMANLAANSIIGNNTGSSATPIALTASQVKTLLGISTSDVSGLGTIATQSASNVFITGGQVSGVTIGGTATGLSISGSTNTLSNIGNSSLTNSSVTINTSGILSGGGSLSLGGTLNLSATEADTLLSVTGRGATTSNGITLSSASPLLFSSSVPVLTLGAGDAAGVLTIKDSNATPNTLLTLTDAGTTGNLSVTGTLLGSNFSGSSSGTNTGDQTITLTSDVTGSGTGSFATTIAGGAVTLGKMANLAANSIIGNNTGSSATPIALTGSQVKTLLGISTSDVSGLGTIATQSASNVFITGGQVSGLISVNGTTLSGGSLSSTAVNGVTTGNIVVTSGSYTDPSWITSLAPSKVLPDQTGQNGKVLSTNGSTLSWITNSSGVAWGAITGTLSDQADLNTALSGKLGTALTSANIFVGNGSGVATGVSVTGDVTIDNTGVTTIGSGKVSLSKMANLVANSIIGNNTGSSATPIALTATQIKTLLSISTSDISGLGTIATQSAGNVFITGGQITGGTINGATIGAVTPASGAFTSLSATSAISAPTSTNTINGLVINSGALSSITTISTSSTINGATLSGGTLSGGSLSGGTYSGTALLGTGSFTITGGTAASETLTLVSTSNITKGDIQFFSASNKITSAGALTIAGALSASNVSGSNTGDQTITLTGDVTGSGTGSFATTIAGNSVALTTDTTGDYVATLTSGNGISAAATGEGSAPTISLAALTADWNQTGAFDIVLGNTSSELKMLESGVTPTLYGILDIGDLSTSDSTFTFSGSSGTVVTSSNAAAQLSAWDQTASDDLTTSNYSTTLDSIYVNVGESPTGGDISGSFSGGLTIAANSVALGTDTTGNYIASATSNGGLTMTGTEGGSLGIALPAATDALSVTTSSGSGLELLAAGVTLLQGCSDGQLLKWNETADTWGCSADNTGAGGGVSTIKEGGTNIVTSAVALNYAAADFIITDETAGVAGIAIDYTNSKITRTDQAQTVTGGWSFTTGTTTISIVDINGGAVDGTTIGATTPSTGAFTTLSATGAITGATATNTINGIIINSGAVSGVSTIGLSGAITGATATNTINGLIINSGALSGITTINASGQITSTLITGTAPFVVASTTNVANLNASSLNGATFTAPGSIGSTTPGSGAFTTLSATGAITGATATNTINGVIINSGAVSNVSTLGLSGAITGATATNTINGLIINSGALSGATTLGLSGAITAATATNTINGIVINSGAVSGVSTLGLSGAISGATATNTINGMIINSGAVSGVTTLGASSTVTIGSGGNTYTFDPSSGPTYAGTAMPTKRITLVPEYAGASLTGTGVGVMTSDNDTTASSYRNYYNWTTSQGASQTYSVWIKVPLPADFDSWTSASALTVEAWSDTLANTAVTATTYDTGNTVACSGVSIEPGSPSTWADTTPTNCTTTGTWAANGIMTVKLDLSSLSGANVRVGRLYLQYKSKF